MHQQQAAFGVHLNVIDCYPDSPWFSWDKICHQPNPRTGALEPVKAWLNPPHKEQSYRLLPQEGVALGMCVSAQALGADGELIRNIILFSVLIYELVGPLATKESLKAAGAITEKPREVLERRERKLAEAEPKELLERRKERANKK